MEIETLYNMVKSAAQGAEKALENKNFEGFIAYASEYNNLLQIAYDICDSEVKNLFQPIDLDNISKTGNKVHSMETAMFICGTVLETAHARLWTLSEYLKGKLGYIDTQIESIIDLIEANLRPSIYIDPKKENDVQNALEIILRARKFDYQREKISIPYSSKKYVPDFTFDKLDLAIETKLCKEKSKEKALVDEINADIPAYKTKYKSIIFIVYDLGFIRDTQLFKSGIEDNENVYIVIIKK